MIKQTKKTYGGIMKDASKYQTPGTSYFDATYGRTTATDNSSEFSFTNEKGTKLEFKIPTLETNPLAVDYLNKTLYVKGLPELYLDNSVICGSVTSIKGLVLFVYHHNDKGEGLSGIWIYDDKKQDLNLIYLNDLGFNKDTNIVAVCNYETEKIEKLYWVDGVHQLRFVNLDHSKANGDREELYEIPVEMLDAVAPFNISQPRIKDTTSGGNHTAGMIQYTYNLYKVNGSQTGIAPMTELIPLKKTDSGGDLNERVDTLPIVEIDEIDRTFDNIKVYSIKYTSLNEEPTISVILDGAIPKDGIVTIYDDNTSARTITLEEFLFLGSDIYIPSDIEVKNNQLFLANYHEKNMTYKFDMRAFSFNKSKVAKVYHNVRSLTSWEKELTITPDNYPTDNKDRFDSINLNHKEYKFKADGKTLGGSGRFCEYELSSTPINDGTQLFFKDNELYRLGIIFYNIYGKTSEPFWIADFISKAGNIEGKYNTLLFNLTQEFYNEISTITNVYLKPVGYKVVIAERTDLDSVIVSSGILTPMMVNYKGSSKPNFNLESTRRELTPRQPKMPNFLVRNANKDIKNNFSQDSKTHPLQGANNMTMMSIDRNRDAEIVIGGKFGGRTWQFNEMMQMYSPELVFNKGISIPNNVTLKVKSALANTFNAVWGKESDVASGDAVTDVRGYDGMTPYFAKYTEEDAGNMQNVFDTAMIEHPGGSNPNRYQRALWYRQYGVRPYNENTGTGSGGNSENGTYSAPDIQEITYNSSTELTNERTVPNVLNLKHTFKNINLFRTEQVSIQLSKFKITPSTEGKYGFRLNSSYMDGSDYYNITKQNLTGEYESPEGAEIYIYNNGYIGSKMSTWELIFTTDKDEPLRGTFEKEFVIKNIMKGEKVLSEYKVTVSGTFDNNQSSGGITTKFQEIVKVDREFKIFGTPEFTFKGQTFKNYANAGEYRYVNTLTSFKADGRNGWKNNGDYGRRIVSINSYNNHCITMVPDKLTYENMYRDLGLTMNNAIMFGELYRSQEDIYLGGLYGGNKYEQKLRTRYREIGEYQDLTPENATVKQHIVSPGDVYVQVFKFLRIAKDTDKIDQGTYQMEEIVEYPCETKINLLCRNDESTMDWDSKIFYEYDNYHKYNQVYSQLNGLITHQAAEYYTKDNEVFGATVIPSKKKSAGELIDSWLNILPNDSLSLDGQYGNIQKLVSFNDQIYAFQNKAIALLVINPRIQIPTEDGVGLQLGVGATLPDYQYVTQSSGTFNKHSIVKSPYGIYYYDDINNSINVFNGQLAPLSETAGLHSYLQRYPIKDLEKTSPRFNSGVVYGYDNINKDVYMTFNFDNYSDTFIFNEKRNMFISRQVHRVSNYIPHNDKLFGTQGNNDLYRFGVGKRGEFFGNIYDTTITFIINPEVDIETIMNTIQFKSEVYNNGKDLPNNTITHYRAYNEFQDTGLIPIVGGMRGNARRFNRDWNIVIGRNAKTRERIRNPWNFLELHFKNTDENLELILHDIIVSYSL